jgi:hypothetical protein
MEISPSEDVTVTPPHASVAVATPADGTFSVWLQPRKVEGGQKVKTGGVISTT